MTECVGVGGGLPEGACLSQTPPPDPWLAAPSRDMTHTESVGREEGREEGRREVGEMFVTQQVMQHNHTYCISFRVKDSSCEIQLKIFEKLPHKCNSLPP